MFYINWLRAYHSQVICICFFFHTNVALVFKSPQASSAWATTATRKKSTRSSEKRRERWTTKEEKKCYDRNVLFIANDNNSKNCCHLVEQHKSITMLYIFTGTGAGHGVCVRARSGHNNDSTCVTHTHTHTKPCTFFTALIPLPARIPKTNVCKTLRDIYWAGFKFLYMLTSVSNVLRWKSGESGCTRSTEGAALSVGVKEILYRKCNKN